MPKPFPEEFRRDVVAVARERQAPLTQIAKGFGISEPTLHDWLKKADIEDGNRAGVNRPGVSGDFFLWEGWSHVVRIAKE